MNCAVCWRPLEMYGTCDTCVGHGGPGDDAAAALCPVCGREERLDGSGEGCARAWLSAATESRATSLRGPTSHDIVDCERAGRLAALARAAVLEAFVRASDATAANDRRGDAGASEWAPLSLRLEAARAAVGEVPGE